MRRRIAIVVALTGCRVTGAFECTESSQCRRGAEIGICSPVGYCAFADPACVSGYRYDELSGGLAGTCVGDEPDAPIGEDADARVDAMQGCLAEVSAGESQACARKSDGSLWCWGRNVEGQLTDLSSPQEMPAQLSMVTGATLVETGSRHTCARIAGNAARCWGRNTGGELGDNSTTNRNTPTAPMGLGAIDDIDGGAEFTCAITSADGGVWCWGRNVEGQLGDGTMAQQLVPVRATLAAGGNLVDAIDVTAGFRHACAIVAGGTAYCWGLNGRGQLGDASITTRPRAVAVMNLTGAQAIEAGHDHTCAIAAAGGVWCWGQNDESQVGDGSGDGEVHTPVMVIASGALALDVGDDHSCALLAGNALRCWGRNQEGEIADPVSTEIEQPTAITDLGSPITALATGGQFSCFVVGTGVKCRGLNTNAQLGIGPADATPIPHPTPMSLALGCP